MAQRSSGRGRARRAAASPPPPLQPVEASPAGAADRVHLWLRNRSPPFDGPGGALASSGTPGVRLLCFPYAGGGASAFAPWGAALRTALDAGSIEVCPLHYPERESRWGEPGFATLTELVEAIRRDLAPLWTQPCAFFGHSFGALVAFEVARALARTGGPLPVRLFVSGARAPRLPLRERIHDLDDPAFLAKIRTFNGVPDEALRHPDLMAAALPALRHDFRLMETHVAGAATPLPVPISAFGGLQDSTVPVADVLAWAGETTKAFRTRFFQGDHFFAFGSGSRIADLIGEDLAVSASPHPLPPRARVAA